MEFCSPNRAPDLTSEELAKLNALGLIAPSSTKNDDDKTLEEAGMTTQTDTVASSSMNVDLNLTAEENEMK